MHPENERNTDTGDQPMFDFLKIKSALSSLTTQMASLRNEKQSLMREREELAVAPGTKADLIDLLHGHIDAAAAKYPARLRRNIEAGLSFGLQIPNGPNGQQLGALSLGRGNMGNAPSVQDLEEGLFFFLAPVLKKGVTDAVNAMEWPAGAEPLSSRPAKIVSLDERISKIENEEKEISTAAADAGVRF